LADRVETKEFLGWFSLRPIKEAHMVELGYRLVRRAWGQGLVTEGSQVLLEHVFRDRSASRVIAKTYEHNAGSIRVMEKIGTRLVGTFKYSAQDQALADTAYHESSEIWSGNDVEYAIDRTAWSDRRGI
jgi:RimJ/RimL family protein N-acetyltransferase